MIKLLMIILYIGYLFGDIHYEGSVSNFSKGDEEYICFDHDATIVRKEVLEYYIKKNEELKLLTNQLKIKDDIILKKNSIITNQKIKINIISNTYQFNKDQFDKSKKDYNKMIKYSKIFNTVYFILGIAVTILSTKSLDWIYNGK